ncbi:MAG: phospholipase D-like domain-containing protein [Myxococcota bacterium]
MSYLDPAHASVKGNRCQLLRDGVEAYPAMLRAIAGARRSVCLETYKLLDDAVGDVFGRALAAVAARGVRVCVLYDWLGSFGSRRGFFRSLRERGVDVRPFRPFSFRSLRGLTQRDHRKLLVVDGEVAFVGGLNISAHGSSGGWRDDVLQVEGPAAAALQKRFFAAWRMQWKDRRRERPTPPGWRGDVGMVVLSSRRAIHAAYLRAIGVARRSVRVAAAYFVPDRRMLEALRSAASRGVEVTLLTAGRSDHPWITWATRGLYTRLMAAGVRIYEWNHGILHSKTAVVDGVWGTVGSFNLERCSLRLNHEVNVVFEHPRLGRALDHALQRDTAAGVGIDPSTWAKRPLWRRLVEGLASVCYRLLHLSLPA